MRQPYRDNQPGSRSLSQARVAADIGTLRVLERSGTTRSSCGAAKSAATCRRKLRASLRPMNAKKLSVKALDTSNGSGATPGVDNLSGITRTPHLDTDGPLGCMEPLYRSGCRVFICVNGAQFGVVSITPPRAAFHDRNKQRRHAARGA